MGVFGEKREKENECLKQQKYPEAVKHYLESIRSNPKDPRVYSNGAACYAKLGALPEGLKDPEECIELDPTFVKGFTRKGTVQYFMRKYGKALELLLMLLITRSNSGRSLRGLFIKYLNRREDKLLMELCLAPRCHSHAFPCISPLSRKLSASASATLTCTSVGLLPCVLTFPHGTSPSTFQTTPSRLSGWSPPCVTAQATMRLHHASALHFLHITFLPWFLALQLSVTTVPSSTTTMMHQRLSRTSKPHHRKPFHPPPKHLQNAIIIPPKPPQNQPSHSPP